MKEVNYIYIEQQRISPTSPVKSELCCSAKMPSGLRSLHADYTKNVIITNSEYKMCSHKNGRKFCNLEAFM